MHGGWLTVAEWAVTVVLALAALYLGIPAWRLSRDQARHAKAAEDTAMFQRRVWQAIAGSDPEAGTSADKPALIDLMRETRDNTAELSQVQTVLAHHMADGHGSPIPAHLWRLSGDRA